MIGGKIVSGGGGVVRIRWVIRVGKMTTYLNHDGWKYDQIVLEWVYDDKIVCEKKN